jgi:SIR2-like domain
MAGHLFITRGDIRHLACHAWLLPTDVGVNIEPVWHRGDSRIHAALGRGAERVIREDPAWRRQDVRAMRMLTARGGRPEVWLGNVGGGEQTPARWVVKAVVEFVRRAAETTAGVEPSRRDRPLLAIPFVGTGEGGLAKRKGHVAKELVRQLRPVLDEVRADVVLVARNPEAFAAAQRARRLAASDWPGSWRAAFEEDVPLGDPYERGSDLAAHARRGRLVLFVGAGVSAGAGLPQWEGLLDRLARRAGLDDADVKDLALLDRATVIETALAPERIGDAVVRFIPRKGPYSLAHSLIASLPTTEIVTTNYDTRLEVAAADAGRPLTILRGRTVVGADRWLLKLHGSVDQPDDIVLSRGDYLGYGQRRAALRGVVQAMLLTRHMLFVGFGLSDDNFHVIAHDVRSALKRDEKTSADPFGTALLVHESPLFGHLWKGDIRPAAVAPPRAEIGVGARRIELLLDLVVAESEGALSHFMDPAFAHLLDPSERRLRLALQRLWRARDGDGPAWDAVGELMERLGGPSANRPARRPTAATRAPTPARPAGPPPPAPSPRSRRGSGARARG